MLKARLDEVKLVADNYAQALEAMTFVAVAMIDKYVLTQQPAIPELYESTEERIQEELDTIITASGMSPEVQKFFEDMLRTTRTMITGDQEWTTSQSDQSTQSSQAESKRHAVIRDVFAEAATENS